MKLERIRLSGFRSFGPVPTEVRLRKTTFLIGPNGAGKTAVLTALCRMFGTEQGLRTVTRSDFHVADGQMLEDGTPASLWIEAEFVFDDGDKAKGEDTGAVPMFFSHMQLVTIDGAPRVRIRLTAELDETGEIAQRLEFVVATDNDGEPTHSRTMTNVERQAIHVHYLPARRDPADHVSYAAGSLLGRALRAADWSEERKTVVDLGQKLGSAVSNNPGVKAFGAALAKGWETLHSGKFYTKPGMVFATGQLDQLLRQVGVSFGPGHGEPVVDFARLSDGQKSLFYLSLVLATHSLGKAVNSGKEKAFDATRLRAPAFTMVAMEEPENSLSPHYLGRVISALRDLSKTLGAQAVVSTHSPSLLRRTKPEEIRYLRLDAKRCTIVRTIKLPKKTDDAHKFVREAVMAFPELYFSRLVILGEGDSEEIVLPRLLSASGIEADGASVCVAPLGGRHVQHFWRLLSALDIPYVTLVDFDLGRYEGGWDRMRIIHRHLRAFAALPGTSATPHPTKPEAETEAFPKWNATEQALGRRKKEREFLETADVFFSFPIDLDHSMMVHFAKAYGVTEDELAAPDKQAVAAVLGKSGIVGQVKAEVAEYFDAYHARFKLGSKPAEHLGALAALDDETLRDDMPPVYKRLIKRVAALLGAIPE
jgi:putative ATP-dependent endonuclease of the OLD family